VVKGGAATLGVVGIAGLMSACDVVAGPFDSQLHLLRRMTFGVNSADRARLAQLGQAAWMAEQLNPSSIDTSASDNAVATMPAVAMSTAELFAAYPNVAGANGVFPQLALAATLRQTNSRAQVFERMVEFWSDHFNIDATGRVQILLKFADDRDVIRPNALGSFRELLRASATSPAMLYYLDNYRSTNGRINENYARELLELHTLGVNGGYSEADVVNTARLLTGWGINSTNGQFQFRNGQHDASPMTILGWVRPSGGDNFAHGVAFLDYLAGHPATAAFVSRKIAVRFVGDNPSAAIVSAMAAAWQANDTQIGPVLLAMVNHPDFASAANSKFNRPLDELISTVRRLDGSLVPTTDTSQLQSVGAALTALGQIPFRWPAPNGYPDVEGAWLNTGSLLARWNMVGDVLAGAYPVVNFDPAPFRAGLDGLSAEAIVARVALDVMHEPVTPQGSAALLAIVGWEAADVPTPAEITTALESLGLALLVSPDAQYR
jgi:uncharacterized protein (DUF1800 family)